MRGHKRIGGGQRKEPIHGELIFNSESVVDNQLVRANAILSDLRKSIAEINTETAPTSALAAGIHEGIGIGFNEYLATTIANGSLPRNKTSAVRKKKFLTS